MTVISDIAGKTESVAAMITDVRSRAGEVLEHAGDLAEQAAAHGWHGVATSIQDTQDHLTQTIAKLGNAEDAIGEALTMLHPITEQISQPEVIGYFGAAITRLDHTRTALDSADDELATAQQAADRAGSPEALMVMLHRVADDIDDARRALGDTRSAAESAQRAAVNWGNSAGLAVVHRPAPYLPRHRQPRSHRSVVRPGSTPRSCEVSTPPRSPHAFRLTGAATPPPAAAGRYTATRTTSGGRSASCPATRQAHGRICSSPGRTR